MANVRRIAASFFFTCACILVWPSFAHAQSAIAGTVKDASGGILPGVIVEAISPVLIEKVRTAVTNHQGQFTITDLRPGVYAVRFTLPGFNTYVRDGLDLPTDFTATINVEMRVGVIEETVTVTGESPIVDVSSTARVQVLTRDALDALPTGRSIFSMAQLVPGVLLNQPDVGGSRAMQQTYMSTIRSVEVRRGMRAPAGAMRTSGPSGAASGRDRAAAIRTVTMCRGRPRLSPARTPSRPVSSTTGGPTRTPATPTRTCSRCI
jgi:hypothetical protein